MGKLVVADLAGQLLRIVAHAGNHKQQIESGTFQLLGKLLDLLLVIDFERLHTQCLSGFLGQLPQTGIRPRNALGRHDFPALLQVFLNQPEAEASRCAKYQGVFLLVCNGH
ncbi:hypothetical protein D3C78_718630 [compost metagenome]